jgi:surfeit locus 1 family protein
VVVVAAVFVRLGFWQLARLDERKASNLLVQTNLEAPVASLDAVLGQGGDVEYRHVTVVGTYAPTFEVFLRNRSYEGQNGYHVLTPLEFGEDSTILVDRGWVPLALDHPPVLPPPGGTVEVTGVLRNSESPHGFGPKDPPTGTLELAFWPDMGRLAAQMPRTRLPGASVTVTGGGGGATHSG